MTYNKENETSFKHLELITIEIDLDSAANCTRLLKDVSDTARIDKILISVEENRS